MTVHIRVMLDQFDIRILAALQERGDMGPVELSELVALSPSQCSRRLGQLKKQGYITAIRAVLDAGLLSVGISAYVLLTMKSHAPEAAESFRTRILQLDEVLECQMLTGAADMILKVATCDLGSFNQLLTRKILGAPEVATAQSSIILEDFKSTSALPMRFANDRANGRVAGTGCLPAARSVGGNGI